MKTRMLGRFIPASWRSGQRSPPPVRSEPCPGVRFWTRRGSIGRAAPEPLQARADLTALDLHHHDRAARCRADIEHLPPVLESVLLRHVQVTAEMDARHDRLE